MAEIVLTDEQARALAAVTGAVTVRDAHGTVYGRFRVDRLTPDEIAERRRAAAPGPRFAGDQVRARLAALAAEWDRTGGFDPAYAVAFVRRGNEADPGRAAGAQA